MTDEPLTEAPEEEQDDQVAGADTEADEVTDDDLADTPEDPEGDDDPEEE